MGGGGLPPDDIVAALSFSFSAKNNICFVGQHRHFPSETKVYLPSQLLVSFCGILPLLQISSNPQTLVAVALMPRLSVGMCTCPVLPRQQRFYEDRNRSDSREPNKHQAGGAGRGGLASTVSISSLEQRVRWNRWTDPVVM